MSLFTGITRLAAVTDQLCSEKSWPFNIFVKSGNVLRRYQPKSDFSYTTFAAGMLIPVVIGEVISNDQDTVRCRILVQAAALARLGAFLRKSPTSPTFVVMAIYVDNDFLAYRHLLYKDQSGQKASPPLYTRNCQLTACGAGDGSQAHFRPQGSRRG